MEEDLIFCTSIKGIVVIKRSYLSDDGYAVLAYISKDREVEYSQSKTHLSIQEKLEIENFAKYKDRKEFSISPDKKPSLLLSQNSTKKTFDTGNQNRFISIIITFSIIFLIGVIAYNEYQRPFIEAQREIEQKKIEKKRQAQEEKLEKKRQERLRYKQAHKGEFLWLNEGWVDLSCEDKNIISAKVSMTKMGERGSYGMRNWYGKMVIESKKRLTN